MWPKPTTPSLKVIINLLFLILYQHSFIASRWLGSFSFVNFEEVPDPESKLTKVLNFCVKKAIQYASENKAQAQRLFVLISSSNMESDVTLTIRKINDDIVNDIMKKFTEVNQSKYSGLYGAPFKVDINAVNVTL